jgi:hypothetical protein
MSKATIIARLVEAGHEDLAERLVDTAIARPPLRGFSKEEYAKAKNDLKQVGVPFRTKYMSKGTSSKRLQGSIAVLPRDAGKGGYFTVEQIKKFIAFFKKRGWVQEGGLLSGDDWDSVRKEHYEAYWAQGFWYVMQKAGGQTDKEDQEVQKHIKKLKDLTDRNMHTEYVEYLASKVLKDPKWAKVAKAMDVIHVAFGFLPPGLEETRAAVTREVTQAMRKKLDSGEYRKYKDALHLVE